jgi:hypothetical protein
MPLVSNNTELETRQCNRDVPPPIGAWHRWQFPMVRLPRPRSQCCTASRGRSFFGFYLLPLHALREKGGALVGFGGDPPAVKKPLKKRCRWVPGSATPVSIWPCVIEPTLAPCRSAGNFARFSAPSAGLNAIVENHLNANHWPRALAAGARRPRKNGHPVQSRPPPECRRTLVLADCRPQLRRPVTAPV